MSANLPNLKQIGGGHCKTLVDLTRNDPMVIHGHWPPELLNSSIVYIPRTAEGHLVIAKITKVLQCRTVNVKALIQYY